MKYSQRKRKMVIKKDYEMQSKKEKDGDKERVWNTIKERESKQKSNSLIKVGSKFSRYWFNEQLDQ